jgi:hypothetical protein
MLPVHTYGTATDTSVIQRRDTAAGQEAVIAIENAREEVCRIIYPAILLLEGILTMSSFRHQDLCMLSVNHADAALVLSLARLLIVLTTNGIRTAGHLHNTAASPVHALDPRIALGLLLGITKILISDTRKATSLHRRNATPKIISNPRSLQAAVVLQLTKTRLMHRLASLVSAHHLVPPPPRCLRRRLHVNHHRSRQMALVESLHFLDRHRHHL